MHVFQSGSWRCRSPKRFARNDGEREAKYYGSVGGGFLIVLHRSTALRPRGFADSK